ncbi:MAG: KAP family NTPase [Leptospiraceae bacterium]|nr:KAP family NTPase [Leptospiraceae bacterium]
MWSDAESTEDYLNFGEIADLVTEIVSSPTMLPVSIGVFGNWGAGKSSVLNFAETRLAQTDQKSIIVRFDAWLYQGYDDVRASLLETIIATIGRHAESDTKIGSRVKALLKRVNWFRAVGLLAEGGLLAAGVPTGGIVSRGLGWLSGLSDWKFDGDDLAKGQDMVKEVKEGAEPFLKDESLSSPPEKIAQFREEYRELLEDLPGPVVVIIDNLDRCLPRNAIQTLEAIRLFLFLPNTAFIIAADEDMIRGAVAEHYSGALERHRIDYLDKLIQVPVRVPLAGVSEITAYICMLHFLQAVTEPEERNKFRNFLEESLRKVWHQDPPTVKQLLAATPEDSRGELEPRFTMAERIAPLLAQTAGVAGNPRIVKRLLNTVKMRRSIAERRRIPLDEAVITKIVLFERTMGNEAVEEFYTLIVDSQRSEKVFRIIEGQTPEKSEDLPESWQKQDSTWAFILNWSSLPPAFASLDLRPALYLARETRRHFRHGKDLSAEAASSLEVLARVTNQKSPNAKRAIERVPETEKEHVMDHLIQRLVGTLDWKDRPLGFTGALLLAKDHSESARKLESFLQGLFAGSRVPPWLLQTLKNESWSKLS